MSLAQAHPKTSLKPTPRRERVAVIGAGIVGVTTAYELARSGHEVTVFERRDTVAAETSYANAGVIAPGYVTPWAAPGMPRKVFKQLFSPHAAIRLAGLGALAELPWMLRWWRACAPQTYSTNRSAMQRLARFSQTRLHTLTAEFQLQYEQSPGYLVLLRDGQAVATAQANQSLLKELGLNHSLVSEKQCRQIEPGLNSHTPLHGGIHLPDDGVGNCRLFAYQLRQQAQMLGARFEFGIPVASVQAGKPVQLTLADGRSPAFDAVVICAGVQANQILRSLGLKLPLTPVFGYSTTAALRLHESRPELGPRSGVMDETFKVAITRLGNRVRVAGVAELGGRLDRLNPAPLRTLYKVMNDWFPGAMAEGEVQEWKGARPMLPDGPPVIGPSGAPGVWLNLGHGSSGWALACGSALAVSESLGGRAAPLDLTGLGVERLRG